MPSTTTHQWSSEHKRRPGGRYFVALGLGMLRYPVAFRVPSRRTRQLHWVVESWATTNENVIRLGLQLEAEYVQRGISHPANDDAVGCRPVDSPRSESAILLAR
jgi:hypothetical protein